MSCGHSDATAAEAHRAFDRGARTVTHLFNAMRPSAPRDPGIAVAALARDDVTVQVIVDGHHLAGETVLVALAGGARALRPGHRRRGRGGHGRRALPPGRDAGHRRGRGGAASDGTLAGSALTMIEAVRNLHALGVELEAALAAASTVPARILGRADLGRLAVGAPADVVVLDDRLEVQRVLVAGGDACRSLSRRSAERPDVVARPAQAALRRAWPPATWMSDSSPATTTRSRPARLASYRAASAARKSGS